MGSALALQEFLRPPPPRRNLKREDAILEGADISRLRIVPGTENDVEEIAVYHWGKGGRRILLVHGWGGKAAQFFSFVGPLLDAGFEVIAFDAPAHGASSGSFASGPVFARAARTVAMDLAVNKVMSLRKGYSAHHKDLNAEDVSDFGVGWQRRRATCFERERFGHGVRKRRTPVAEPGALRVI
jgi:pimeloyl-ACP methyl ester carboxylesterase